MKVSVVYALPEEQVWMDVMMEEPATVLAAITQSNIIRLFPNIDLEKQKVGVFGKVCQLDTQVNDGDRIEIYRPITWKDEDEDDDD
ncbi:hypothetical protein SAMN04488136_11872 [Vibrio xiamenensis]|uniref:UPF0125 protein SAMN04488136_11872 n=1 Tax=Vibrio xiamenensis TaxID=861298 RepID=A0A1G8D344_9VIBR|nr:RnfH family protein [Vibrio xiamenensis]SDH52101.1 hypothetical protein SAMN04488136_11872 [Vibrio xiamenensis]